jgi:voltage-gated potassium channel Kch
MPLAVGLAENGFFHTPLATTRAALHGRRMDEYEPMTGDHQPGAGSGPQPAPALPREATAGDDAALAQSPRPPEPRRKPRAIRRVPKPRMTGLLDSPVRNLTAGVAYTITVMIVATVAYMATGWSFRDAIYMVIVTVYTVGYNEVRPINTPALNIITIGLIVLGCTGIIFLTGALVQFFTLNQLNKITGLKRMNTQIDELKEHVVVCGFGRLGTVLARSLRASSAGFVILEENEARATEARLQGYLCIHGDATSEAVLLAAGVMRANALATVLSNDALNVFITLSARALNPNLSIVARGELSSTESKLLQAGADKVVLPTHIGAERIAEVILYEESARFIEGLERSHGFQRVLHNFGMELEVVTAAPQSPAVRMTVAAIERQSKGAFFIIQINRRDGDVFTAPPATTVVGEGDGVVLIGRPNRAEVLTSLFEPRVRGARG